MSAWSTIIAFSGFDYHGALKAIALKPRMTGARFRSIWSAGPGWGVFSISRANGRSRLELEVTEGSLPLRSIALAQTGAGATSVVFENRERAHAASRQGGAITLRFNEDLVVPAGGK
jgi:hypothetical protein